MARFIREPAMEKQIEVQRLLAKTSGKMGMTHKEVKELALKAKEKKSKVIQIELEKVE